MAGRERQKNNLVNVPMYIVDLLLLWGNFYLSYYVLTPIWRGEPAITPSKVFIAPVFLLLLSYVITCSMVPSRVSDHGSKRRMVISQAWIQAFVTTLVFMMTLNVVYNVVFKRLYIVIFVVAGLSMMLSHLFFASSIKRFRSKPQNMVRAVIIGADFNAVELYNEMVSGREIQGYSPSGFLASENVERIPDGASLLGPAEDAAAYISKEHPDEVYCSLAPDRYPELLSLIIHACEENFAAFFYVPNMDGYVNRRMSFSEFGDVTIIKLREEPLGNPLSKIVKRLTDIIVSGLFLVTMYPFIWLFVAIGIKISSPGPILFKQRRTGYSGHSFWCLKFRSMKVNADSDKVQATADDPRKTKFGDFIRRTSIDELPQFINVFRGDMSIIGPRPHMEFHTDKYSELISDYMVRHLVKPGITGWAQVNGCRGETKEVSEMKARVEHDIWYIEHWSPSLDIKIFFMTIAQIFGGDKQAY